MKKLIISLISLGLIVSGYSQTRSVLVGTNNAVVSPTNFWSADASNARSGLGLGTAATNPATAFQPSSLVLSNLASSNAVNLTNIRATNITGALSIVSGGTGATNAATARTNLGLGWSALTNSNAATSLLCFTTNGTVFANTGTNVLTFTNAIRVADTQMQDAEISWAGGPFINFEERVFDDGGGSGWQFNQAPRFMDASGTRDNLGLGATWLTNTNVSNFRTAINLGNTNDVTFKSVSATSIKYEGSSSTAIDLADGILRNVSQNVLEFGDAVAIYAYLPIQFVSNSFAATTRNNLGLGATWLTNTNVTNFRTAIGLGWPALINTNAGTSIVSVNTNGDIVSPTNFWQQAPIATTVAFSAPITNSTNAATNSRNLIIQSLSSSINNTTNTLLLPTNTSTFNGDTAVVIHSGGSGSATAVRQTGQTSNLIVLTNFDHAVRFLYFNNTWDFYHNIAFVEPIYFSGTNAEANAAASRTNLGLPLTALTNTNNSNFQAAVFTTNTAPTNGANLGDAKAWIQITVSTNGTNHNFRIPIFQ